MTYSIVAHDPDSGQMGIAVQSHHLAVGAHVVAAEAGVGVLAVQSYAHRGYATEGLARLRAGHFSENVLSALLEADPRGSRRAQVSVLDARGSFATHTGSACVAAAGHSVTGRCSVQANMVRTDRVWAAMADAFEASTARFPLRLVDALDAAQAAGGDLRGQQSAALQVVPTGSGTPARVIDLRVDDSVEPLTELRRLEELRHAKESMSDAFDAARSGDVETALSMLDQVQDVYGDANLEPTAWAAVIALRGGDETEAITRLKRAVASEPGWLDLVASMPAADLLPVDPGLLRSVLQPLRADVRNVEA